MAFSVDYNKATEGTGLIPPGTYETLIREPHLDMTRKTQEVYLSIPLVIRNDLAQPYQNSILWYSMRQKRKDPDAADIACDGYSAKMIHTLSRAAGLPNGKAYGSIEDWLADLDGKLIRISVKHRVENGKTFYDYGFPEQTKYTVNNHQMKPRTQQPGGQASLPTGASSIPPGFTQVNEDELPF
jgi:hypothetical protein